MKNIKKNNPNYIPKQSLINWFAWDFQDVKKKKIKIKESILT